MRVDDDGRDEPKEEEGRDRPPLNLRRDGAKDFAQSVPHMPAEVTRQQVSQRRLD
jgi:hypothetical protein